MATIPQLFAHMPRVDYEIKDRNLRLTPEFRGKHVVLLGPIDVDGYGYLNPARGSRDWASKFVTPGSVLRFNEPTRALDLTQMTRLYATNPNVGDTDEITPALAEVQEQGATNVSFMRLDMAMVEDATGTMRYVQQSTGLPPEAWLTAMGFTLSGATWSAKATLDPLTDYVPSVAYRNFVAALLEITDHDVTTEQAHNDPSDADFRYWALGRALNNLIGVQFDILVATVPPGWVNPAKAWGSAGVYPLRTDLLGAAGFDPDEVIETGAPTVNNPNLGKVVLDRTTLAFKSFDAIGYDHMTITVPAATTIAVGDKIAISAGTYGIVLTAVAADATPNYGIGEFRVSPSTAGKTDEEIAILLNNVLEDMEDAVMQWVLDTGDTVLRAPVTAVAVDNVLTLTSIIPGPAGRIAAYQLVGTSPVTFTSNKPTAIFNITDNSQIVTTASSETTLTVTSNAITTTIKAGAAAGTGVFAKGANATATAASIATLLNSTSSGKLFAFSDGAKVVVTSRLGGSTYNLTGTATADNGITFTDGAAGPVTLTALSGSHLNAADRNFAHLLGNFAFWQSYYEQAVKVFIGTEPWDTDMDGVVTADRAREVIGRERYQTLQYVDDADGVLYTDDGTGLLGFTGMKALDGIHRRRSNPDLPVGYKLFAHSLGMLQIQEGRQEDVVMYTSRLGDSLIEDSDKGELMDMGARLRIIAGDGWATNQVSGRYNESNGAYVTNGAATAAGLEAVRPSGRSLTKLRLRNFNPMRRLSHTQMNNLLKARLIPLQQLSDGTGAAEIQADNTAAFNIDEYHRSDFVMGLSVDVLDDCVQDIRIVGRPLLGRGMSPQVLEHFTTEAEQALMARVRLGHIQDFRFRILATPAMQVLGEVEFSLEVIPAFEIRKIHVKAGLAMPKNALVAYAGTF